MTGLFFAHAFEDQGSGGVGVAQGIGKFAVDAAVFLFVRDGEGQDLFFGQILEPLEHRRLILEEMASEENRITAGAKPIERPSGRKRGKWEATEGREGFPGVV